MAQGNRIHTVQQSVKDPNIPPEIRLAFVKKVYGILATMLGVSFAIATPFIIRRYDAMLFMIHHPQIEQLVLFFFLAHVAVNLAMSLERCCGGNAIRQTYLKMFVTVPWNYVFCFSFAASCGVMLGLKVSRYSAESVIFVFLLTAGLVVALTFYAIYTECDFTGYGAYLFVAMFGLFLGSLLLMLFPGDALLHKLFSAFGAVLFSCFVVYDTQLIFGTASMQFGHSACRKLEFTVDMYCYAAYQLYLDFINLFIYLLELFGERRE